VERDRDQVGVSLGKPGDAAGVGASTASVSGTSVLGGKGRVPWWRLPGFVVFCLVFMPPAGLILVWRLRWGVGRKALVSVLSAVWFVTLGTSGPPSGPSTAAGPGAPSRAPAFPTVFPAAPAATTAAARAVTVPDYRGQNLKQASSAAYEAGFSVRSHDATEGDRNQFIDSNWTVCFQEPHAGTTVIRGARRTRIEFAVVDGGNRCPPSDGAPITFERMPNVVGKTFETGATAVRRTGPVRVEGVSTYTDVDLAAGHGNWQICFQYPKAGEELENPAYITVRLALVRPGMSCPDREFTRLHPDPDRGGSGGDSGNGSGGGSGGVAYYRNCDAVRAAGRAPIYRGQTCYR
jgi:hypothetical protein